MGPNQKPSEGLSLLATVDPISQGAGAASTGWVNAAEHHALMALVDVGVFGASATVDAKLQQAQDNAGTGAKDVTGKAITQLLAAGGNNRQAIINARGSDLDTNNGFYFVRLTVTVGVAATVITGQLFGFYPRFEDGASFNQAGVAQIV